MVMITITSTTKMTIMKILKFRFAICLPPGLLSETLGRVLTVRILVIVIQ